MSANTDKQWMNDVKAGLVVFLIALPLSLGISIASGAPSTAGLISAIMGGLVGAYLGGSYVTINGPAAGLIVVVLSAIQSLSFGDPVQGFKRFLACVLVVGALQVISGLLKAGRFAALFPTSVVHGMMTSIGIIIMIKQVHVLFGQKAQGSIFNSIITIPQSISQMNVHATMLAVLALAVLLVYPKLKAGFAKIIPAPLVVVLIGMVVAYFFTDMPMVKIPLDIREFLITPQFDMIYSRESILAIFSLFFVASLESILSASAVDKLDTLQRESDFNRELWSKGIVNMCCGLLGGLPIIAEIVRSSANIQQGAKTPLSNFSHSSFMLVFAALLPATLNMIPLPVLAAILILVGYRLGNPKQFKEMQMLGISSFLAFSTTILLTLAEDLLVGIAAGIVVKLIVSSAQGARLTMSPKYNVRRQGDQVFLDFEHSLAFFSAIKQREIINGLGSFDNVEINLKNLQFIDPTSLAVISRESARLLKAGKKVSVLVPEKYQHVYHHIKAH
ncbi:MAG: SulP family inorganic anion transporter [Bdellovibrionota bacterium]